MPEEKPKSKAAKSFDIAKVPTAQATSRPVIVGHGGPVRDPMMAPIKSNIINAKTPGAKITPPSSARIQKATEEASAMQLAGATNETPEVSSTDTNTAPTAPPVSAEPVQPTAAADAVTVNRSPQTVSKVIQPPSAETEAPESSMESTPDESAESLSEPDPAPSPAPETPSPAPDVASPELGPPPSAANPDQPAVDMIGKISVERMTELKNGKEYKVAIGKRSGGKTSWLAIILIIVLLGLGIAIALDAGWIDLGFNVPFDFIK